MDPNNPSPTPTPTPVPVHPNELIVTAINVLCERVNSEEHAWTDEERNSCITAYNFAQNATPETISGQTDI